MIVDTSRREVRPDLSDLSSSRKRDTCTGPPPAQPPTPSRGPSLGRGTPGGTSIPPPRSPSSRISDATNTSRDQQLQRTTSRDPSPVPDTCSQAGSVVQILIRREVSSGPLRDTSASRGYLKTRLVLLRGSICSGLNCDSCIDYLSKVEFQG